MAFTREKAQANIGTTATVIYLATNPSGVDLGNIHVNSTVGSQTQLYMSVVPTGSSMTANNSIAWNLGIGGSGGLINMCFPFFMGSGDSLQASGSATGLNAYISYLKYT